MAARPGVEDAAIRTRIETLVEAIRAMDLEGVKAMYAPDIVSFDVQPPLQHVGTDAKGRNWEEAFAAFRRPLDYDVRDLAITVHGDVAFAHGFSRLRGTLKNGTRSGFWVRATLCLRKVDGDWLIAHDHVSVPLDLATGRAVVDLEPAARAR